LNYQINSTGQNLTSGQNPTVGSRSSKKIRNISDKKSEIIRKSRECIPRLVGLKS